jgi:MFS family permease
MGRVSSVDVNGVERARLVTRPFVVVTLTALVFFVYIGMLVPIVPLFIEGPLGGGEFAIGINLAVFAIAAILIRPLIGRIADRHGRRILMMGGAALTSLGGAAAGFSDTLWQLLVLRALMGIGEAAVFVGAATLIADLSPRDRRAEGASYFSVAVFGGLGVGPILGERLLDDTHFERAFFVAGMFALSAVVLAMFAPARVTSPDDVLEPAVDPPDGLPTGVAHRGGLVSNEPAGGKIPARPARRRFIHPAALMPGLVLASGVAGFMAFGAFLPEYARTVGLRSSGGLFAVYALVSVLVRIFGATLPERLGPRRSVTIALGNIMVGLIILAAIPTVPALWVAAVFVGIGAAFNYPALLALTVNRASDGDRAWAVSSFTMFFEVGAAAGGLVIGAFAQVVGKQIGFLGGVASCLLGLWLLRTKVVPAGAPDAGPATAPVGTAFVPVAGD